MAGLAVIIGAGASFDCADDKTSKINLEYKPPLVNELFLNRDGFNAILNKYPKARALSARIRDGIAAGQGLEDILRDLSTAPQGPIRQQYFQVPLYLQELIGEVGTHFITAGASRFDTLVGEIERSWYEHVLYITVNYDLFIERALRDLYDVDFTEMAHYCEHGRKWGLVKLHGSVKWGRKLLNGHVTNQNPFTMELRGDPEFDDEIKVLAGYQDTARALGGDFYFPSLAVPIGGKEEFACPPDHVDEMMRRMQDCQGVLIIGFSGLDTHVVKLFDRFTNVKRVGIVNENAESARSTIGRCTPHNKCFKAVPEDVTYGGGFAQFVRSGQLRGFLSVMPT